MWIRGSGWFILLTVLGLLASCGRLPWRKAENIPPAPAATAAELEPPKEASPVEKPPEQPIELPEPPEVVAEETDPGQMPAPLVPVAEAPPAPPPAEAAQKPKATDGESAEQKAAKRPVSTAEPVVVPKLTQLLGKQEEWEYNREIDEKLLKISQILSALEKRPLSAEQLGVLARVRAFADQTTETRKVDLITASSLVRRAELLAQDLEESTR